MQRCSTAVGGHDPRVSACIQEYPYDGSPTLASRDVERSVSSDPRSGVELGSSVEEYLHQLRLAQPGGPVERRHPIALCRVHVGTVAQKGTHSFDIAVHRRVRDR